MRAPKMTTVLLFHEENTHTTVTPKTTTALHFMRSTGMQLQGVEKSHNSETTTIPHFAVTKCDKLSQVTQIFVRCRGITAFKTTTVLHFATAKCEKSQATHIEKSKATPGRNHNQPLYLKPLVSWNSPVMFNHNDPSYPYSRPRLNSVEALTSQSTCCCKTKNMDS